MQAGLALQYAIVGLAVLASAFYVFATRFPATARRVRGHVAIALVNTHIAVLMRIGRRIAPPPSAAGACGTCGGCDPAG